MDTKKAIDLSRKLFEKRAALESYWQEVCEQFYPEIACFTSPLQLGEDFSSHLTTSYPILARRELCDTFASMLRPTGQKWFRMEPVLDEAIGLEEREWLEWAADTQRRAMYDRLSGFKRATKQGDHDFGTLGQCCISVELNGDRTRYLYRHWHLRDVVWRENAENQIDTIFRRWKPTAMDLAAIFPGKVHPSVQSAAERDPYREINCLHAVTPSDGEFRQPFASRFIDADNNHSMEYRGSWSKIYVIPRWQTLAGTQYAHSPAVIAALPDARLIQAISLTLLDAGEMYAAPPMLAVKDAIRGDIDLRARGITWVDAQYDERLGEVLRPLTQDARGFPIGDSIRAEAREMIAEAFYLSKLRLPPADGREMTAYETSERVKEFIRTTLPLFEPIEEDYNGALCDETFDLGLRNGMFGPLDSIPEGLRGHDIEFKFVSPLTDAQDRIKGAQFIETRNMLGVAAQMEQLGRPEVDVGTALRDALEGVGSPAAWLRSEEEVAAAEAQKAQMAQMQMLASGVERAAQVGEQVATAGAAMQQLDAAPV